MPRNRPNLDSVRHSCSCAARLFVALIATAGLGSTVAATEEPLPSEPVDAGWTIYADNDELSPSESDANYTAGFSVSLAGRRARDYPWSLDRPLGRINRWLGVDRPEGSAAARTYHSFGFGMAAFTPITIGDTAPRFDQRPYACLTFLHNTRQTVVPARASSYYSTLVVGLLGTNVCESLQNFAHSVAKGTRARGWSHQISDGGEPTLLWRGARQQLLAEDLTGPAHHQLTWTADAQVGYVTDLGIGLSWRWGNLRTPWWSFAPQQTEYVPFSTPQLPQHRLRVDQPVESYVWAGGMLRYRLYNGLLQGQFRDSTVEIPGDRLKPLIAEI